MALRIPSPKALTKPEAYLAYKAGILSRDELKQNLYNPLNNYEGWLAKWCGLLETYPTNKDGTPQCLTDEEGLLAYLCGVTDRYPASNSRPDDARISAYIRYLVSARYTRPDHPLNREEFYLSLIKTQFIPSCDPSSDIVIDGTAKAPFVDVKMYGDTFQQTYTGKNHINADRLGTNTDLGITGEPIGNGILRIHGTATGSGNAKVIPLSNHDNPIPAGTYTATIEYLGGTYSGKGYYLHVNQLNGQPVQNFNNGETHTTVEASQNYDFRVQVTAGQECDFRVRIMLESGEAQTAYEPYVGGTPSPNPDYPQAIQTVTGEQVVKVVGKNLFNNVRRDITSRGIEYTVNADGTVNIHGTATGGEASFSHSIELSDTNIKNGTVYTWWANKTIPAGLEIRVGSYNGNTWVGHIFAPGDRILSGTLQSLTKATNISSEATRLVFQYCVLNGATVDIDGIGTQLELGSTATSYVPYTEQSYPIDLGNIKLCNLTDHEDYIYEDMGDWILHKETVSAKISNDITWVTEGYAARKRIYAQSGSIFGDRIVWPNNNVYKANMKCDHFSTVSVGSILDGTADGIGCSSSGYISIRCSSTGTVQELLDILDENDITAIAALYTPTDTVITDQALIAQLNALKQGGAEDGTTYIKVSATDPNLPAKLYVEAPKYD